MAPTWEMRKAKRRWAGALANNAVVAAFVAAAVAVAGIISYAVARSQARDAARQVMVTPRAPAASQREQGVSRLEPEVRGRWIGALTNNGVAAALLAAGVAALTSYAVAHYQEQATARQAMSAQQASAALQLEAAATSFYQFAYNLWPSCVKNPHGGCLDNAYANAEETFLTAISNDSDPTASGLAKQLANSMTTALTMAGSTSGSAELNQVGDTFRELIGRCGQLVTGQQ